MPLLESLLGTSPSRAIAKKAAALPSVLTNGCGAVAAPPGDLSSPGASNIAALDAGKQAPDVQPSSQQIELSSRSNNASEGLTANSTEVDGLEVHSSLLPTSAVQVAGQPHAALAAATTYGAARLLPSSHGDAPRLGC